MPIITNPPILIDPSEFSRQSAAEINPMGPFLHGTDLYLVLITQNTARVFAGVYKSTDGGNTWTLQDTANKPDANGLDIWVSYDSASGVIFVVSASNSPPFSWLGITFDTNTDTYGTTATKLSFAPAINDSGAFTYRKASGDQPFVYIENTTIKYLLESAAAWSGPTSIHNYGSPRFCIAGIGHSDVGHFIYIDNSNNVFYNQLSSLFALGTEISFGTVADNKTGDMLVWNGKIVFAYTSTQKILVEIGDGLTDPVTFTEYVIDTVAGAENLSYARLAIDKDGNLVVFWVDIDYTTTPITDRLWMSTFDGVSTWGAKVLFYDEFANQPANSVDQADQFIHTGEGIQLADSTWIYTTALETLQNSPAVQICTGFMLIGSGSPPPSPSTLQLLKVVQGGPSSPSDFTLTATGGSPETEISGPGPSVGPDEVNPGVFQLGEIAPGGALWDAATSTWDGTTVWDSGSYSVVWSCNATMPTPTSVVVGAGGGPAVVGSTQVPTSDPTFRSLLSGGRFEFLFGDNVYQVGWTSNNKLGVFMRPAADAGSAWTEQDAFGSPEQGDQSGYGKCIQSGSLIVICYLRIGRTEMVIVTFDTNTNTWGSITAAMVVESALTTFAFGRQSDGTYVVWAGGASHFYYATNTGGVWNGPNNVQLNKTQVIDGFMDSADAMQLLYNQVSAGINYVRADNTFALGSPTGIANAITFTLSRYPSIIPFGADSVSISVLDNGGGDANKMQVWIGTPLAAAAFTTYIIDTPGAGMGFTFPKTAVDQAGDLHAFYVNSGSGVDTIQESDFNGSTWNTPATFYDAVANPPTHAVPDADQQISALDPVDVATSSPMVPDWCIGAAMETLQPTEVSTAQAIEASNSSSAVVCTATNIFTGPPPGPPGPGQMNPVGCFELLRVDVTLTPARHLPVRGSVK